MRKRICAEGSRREALFASVAQRQKHCVAAHCRQSPMADERRSGLQRADLLPLPSLQPSFGCRTRLCAAQRASGYGRNCESLGGSSGLDCGDLTTQEHPNHAGAHDGEHAEDCDGEMEKLVLHFEQSVVCPKGYAPECPIEPISDASTPNLVRLTVVPMNVYGPKCVHYTFQRVDG